MTASIFICAHPIVIVDEIRPLKDGYYTLETAIAAIVSYQQESGVKYERTGLIITYKTGEYEMETRQFQGAVSDFATPSLWKPFGNGGGGSVFETSDEPAEGRPHKHTTANLLRASTLLNLSYSPYLYVFNSLIIL